MVETWLLFGLGGIVIFIGSVIGGFLAKLVWEEAGVLSLERRLKRLENAAISPSGVSARQEQSAEVQQALAEAMQVWKGEGTQDEKLKAIANIAASKPAVTMKILRQLGIRF